MRFSVHVRNSGVGSLWSSVISALAFFTLSVKGHQRQQWNVVANIFAETANQKGKLNDVSYIFTDYFLAMHSVQVFKVKI